MHLWSVEINIGGIIEIRCHFNMHFVLGIGSFINLGTNTISKFQSVVSQIQKNERDIESKLQSMVMANLLKLPVTDKSNDLPGTADSMEFIGYGDYTRFQPYVF